MFEGRLPSFANTRSMRVAGGLGTVARVVGDAQEIYGQRIPVDDAIRRIEGLYKPYHRALRRLFAQYQGFRGGRPDRLSLHALDRRLKASVRAPTWAWETAMARAASRLLWKRSKRRLRAQGYSVSRNKPYAGGFIPERCGNPAAACMPSHWSSTGRSIWTSGASSARRPSPDSAADLEALADCLAAIPSRSCGLIARQRNNSARNQIWQRE